MRLLGTLPDEKLARRLGDYLLTLGIDTRISPEAGKWEVWVRDDDHMPRAKQEWEPFQANPDDPRFQQAAKQATTLKHQQEEEEAKFRRNQRRAADLWAAPRLSKAPFTIGVIAFCILVAVLTRFKQLDTPVMQAFTFGSYRVLPDNPDSAVPWERVARDSSDPWLEGLRQGQLWRLWTPIFLHFDIWHLVLNLLAFLQLGLMIESRKGTVWMVGFVLVMGLLTNVSQYFLSPWFNPEVWRGLAIPIGHPLFGGMSGVLFALFGYLWMKVQYDPEPGLYLDRQSVYMMLVWMVLCMTGAIGAIANTAHVSGLLAGMAAGLAPAWRRLQGREL